MSARKANSRQAVRASSNTFPGWLWLIVGILLGLALSGVAIWRDWVPSPKHANSGAQNEKAPDLSSEEPVAASPPPPAAAAKPSDPEFDFYTVLPEMQVVVPEAQAPNLREEATPPLPPGFRYLLQLGSFGAPADAESLKAKAALAGVVASVQKVSIDDKTFYRVRVGPFATPAALESARAELGLAGLSAVALREKI